MDEEDKDLIRCGTNREAPSEAAMTTEKGPFKGVSPAGNGPSRGSRMRQLTSKRVTRKGEVKG
jgi:hypothetical protein